MKITKPSAIAAVDLPCPVCGELCVNSSGSQMIDSTDMKVTCPRCRIIHRVDPDVFLTKDERLEEIAAIVKTALAQLPKMPLTRKTEHAYLLGISAAEQAFHLILAQCKTGESND